MWEWIRGDREHRVVVWDCRSEQQEAFVLEQTPLAVQQWAASLRARYRDGVVAVAIEQSRGPLFDALVGYDFFELYPINPRAAARYREAFRPSTAKDDPTDAESLLDMVRKHREQLRRFVPDDACTRMLRLLVEDRRSLVDERTRHVLRIQATLKSYYPQAIEWAGSLETEQACAFLEQWPTLQQLKRARKETVRKFYASRAHPSERIERTLAEIAVAVTLVSDEVIIDAAVLRLRAELAQVRALTGSIKEFDQRIASLFEQHEDGAIFRSLPGAGPQLAPRLAVVFGTVRDRFSGSEEIACRSGIAPVMKRSGKSTVVQMRWAAPTFTRQSLHEFARVSIGRSKWAREFYQGQRRRGVGQHAAVRALAYRWLRVIYACWRDRRPYDEELYIKQLVRRGSPLACIA
jgi:transposase